MFVDRQDAGRQLAAVVSSKHGADPETLVIALPRGGVPVAAEIAHVLKAPLDILLVRKLGAPGQPELAIGALCEGDPTYVVWNENLIREIGVTDAFRTAVFRDQQMAIEAQRKKYLKSDQRQSFRGRTIIIVDDGVATGATTRVAIEAARAQRPKSICLAIPVGAPDTVKDIRPIVDLLVCLETPSSFRAVGCSYQDFGQTSDGEVARLLTLNHSGRELT